MYKITMVKAVFFLLILSFLVAAGEAQPQSRPEYLPDEVLVKFKDGISQKSIDSIVQQINGKIIRKFRIIPVLQLKIPTDTVQQVINLLKGMPEVEYAEPNYLRYLDAIPNDTRFSEMWGLNNTGQTGGTPDADIDAVEAWDITTGNANLVVADIDSGMDMTHPDLAANVWTNPGEIPGNGIDDDGNGYIDDAHGWDFAWDDNDPSDSDVICGGHGTHTSGTIGARGNNGIGVTGINWNVKIMPLKVFRTYFFVLCSATSSDIISAIEYATMMGVRVSNNSYGSSSYSQAEFDAIQASRSVFVAAAGNEGTNNDIAPSYPASYDLNNIISVAATDHNDALASFSNYGVTSVDLVAPGVNILSTTPNNTYSLFDGTSMATPHVTGAVALLMGYNSSLTNNEVKWRILKGSDYKGLPVFTGGRLNINNSLRLPPPQVTIDVSPIGSTTVSPGDIISYNVTVHNNESTSKTVNASIIAVYPNGSEVTLTNRNVNIPGNGTLSQNFSKRIPLGTPTGEYQLAGRAEIPSTSYDEDIVLYTVAP
jgi:subtilisin family serine protease